MIVGYCKRILFLTLLSVLSIAQSHDKNLSLQHQVNIAEQQQSSIGKLRKKALLAIFGVLSRSTRITWPQIEKMIVTPLAKDYDVSIYVQDNQLDNVETIDGMPIQASSQSMIKSTWPIHYQSISQSEIDADLSENYRGDQGYLPGLYARKVRQCRGTSHCQRAHTVLTNAKRQFYQEQLVSDYLVNNGQQYDIVIVIGADFYPLLPIDVQPIELQLSHHPDWLFTSPQNPVPITNGFYIGKPQIVAKAMSMLNTSKRDDFAQLKTTYYEEVLSMTLQAHQIKSVLGLMYFCKLRNNGVAHYHNTCRFGARCRDGLTDLYDGLSPEHRLAIKDELSRLKLYWSWRQFRPKHLRDVYETLFGISEKQKEPFAHLHSASS